MTYAAVTMGDCTELKKLMNPPKSVKDLASATLALLGVIGTIDVRNEKDPRMWKYFITNILKTSGVSLVSRMATFDPSSVTKGQVEMAKRFVGDLTIERTRSVSMAAAGLFLWVSKAIQDADK